MPATVEELVHSLTLEEKAGLCSGQGPWHTKAVARLGIPAMMVSDGPHGLRAQRPGAEGPNDSVEAVCYPAGCAAAASFDPALTRRLGAAVAREAQAAGVGVVLGPAINIKRSPLCGRNFEYYSEDPFLAGELAAGFIRGAQGEGVGACPKHFAANNQETRRLSVDDRIDERTLHEIYLPPFETAVRDAQPWCVMSSYNRVNGVYASENPLLLDEILRGQWGFTGFVMSDWGAVSDRVRALAAGLHLEMPGSGGVNDAKIVAAVRSGALDEAVLDKAVARILNIVLRAADLARPAPADREAGHALAVRLAKESAVLLQNLGALPLREGQKVAYIGALAAQPRYQGGGSSHVNTRGAVGALQAAQRRHRNVRYVEGFPAALDQRDEAEFLRAVAAAEEADAAVIFAGLPESFESEGADRRHMRLPDCQNNLIARVAAVQKNTVVYCTPARRWSAPGPKMFRPCCACIWPGRAWAKPPTRCCGATPTPPATCPRPGPCGWRIRPATWISPATATPPTTARASMWATAGTTRAACRCAGRSGTGCPTPALCTRRRRSLPTRWTKTAA